MTVPHRLAEMADNILVCPFLTDDASFAQGVEFGLLYAKMRRSSKRIKGFATPALFSDRWRCE